MTQPPPGAAGPLPQRALEPAANDAEREVLCAEHLRYALLDPRGPAGIHLATAYETWHQGWLAALRELNGTRAIHSDEFSRQDEIGALFFEGRCVSVTALRWLNFDMPMAPADSYFLDWPPGALVGLSDVVAISCNTLLLPASRHTRVRSDSESLLLEDLTLRLSLRRFLDSDVGALMGVVRSDGLVRRVASALGAKTVASIRHHGVESDIVRVDRADIPELGGLVEGLWSRRAP